MFPKGTKAIEICQGGKHTHTHTHTYITCFISFELHFNFFMLLEYTMYPLANIDEDTYKKLCTYDIQ